MSPQRQILAGVLAAVVAAFTLVGAAVADDQPITSSSVTSQHPIVRTALQYEGTHGGQCWTFVKAVVFEALGIQMGFDYHWGFLQEGYFDEPTGRPTGAIEVGIDDGQPGDIIQFADPADTHPWAEYPGLHTAIITGVVRPGVYSVIDSNAQWDETVRWRPSYDLRAILELRREENPNIGVRLYRFPVGDERLVQGAVPAFARTVADTPPRSFAGLRVVTVNTPGESLNLRAAPGMSGEILRLLRHGTQLAVLGGDSKVVDGLAWVKVSTMTAPYAEGWVAAGYLQDAGTATSSAAAGSTQKPVLQYRTVVTFLAH
jgi:hypothetical protein